MGEKMYRRRPLAVDEREAKLPRWAQELISDLRHKTADAEEVAERAVLATNPEGSDAVLSPHSEAPIGLGKRPVASYRVPFLGQPNGWIQVRLADEGHGVNLMGSSSIIIEPHVTNSITIRPGRW
jgi:hypothetical protein